MMAVTKDMENGPTYRPRHRTAGALLFLGHLLETTVQIFVCYHYFDGFPRWAGGLTAILLAAALIVNLASIVGVQQSLDFADRCFGQCLCYTMHLCGLGLVWRYLKLAMLYDYADLKEFALLRFIQVHLQTLPSLLLQASLVYQGQGGWQWSNMSVLVVPMLLVGLQLVSVTVTLVSSTVVLMPHHTDYTHNYCHKTLINWCPPTITTLSANKGAVGKSPAFWRDCEGGGSASANRQWMTRSDGDCFTLPLTTVKSFSLLACRLFAVAVFMMEFHVWTLIIFGVHWCITLLWLVVQDSPSELDTATPVASLCRRVVVAYLLVFDWPSTSYNNHHNSLDTPAAVNASRGDDTAVNLKVASGPTTTTSLLDILVGHGGAPRTVAMAVYYGVVGLENAVMVSLWFQFASLSADDEHAPLVRLGTLAFCVATFTIGILCVLVSTKGCQSPNEKEPLPANCVDLRGGDGASMQIEPLPDKHFYMHSNLGEKQANASSFAVTQALVHQHQHQHLVQSPPQHLHHHSISPNHPPPPVPINCSYILPNNSSSSNNHLLAPAYAATELHWEAERIREDDESSNSRNTNTLEGALGSANGGSGLLALAITPSPPITVRRPQLVDPSIKVLGLSRLPLQSVEYRDRTGSFTGSHSSFATALASLTRPNRPLPLPHKPRCSTPKKQRARPRASLQQQPQQRASLRLCRQASSSDSLATIPPRAGQHSRTYRCFTKKRHQRRKRMCRRYNRPCHCRIFDQSEQVGFGLLVQETKLSRGSLANTLPTATTATNKLTNNNSNRLTARGQDVGRQGRQLRIFCASCLEAHDPLLTHCAQCRQYQVSPYKSQTLPSRHPTTTPADATADSVMNGMQMTRRYSVYNMDYPSDTEITAGLSRQSVISSSDSSLDSEATYTTWPPPRQASSNVLRSSRLPGEVPSWSYVHSWLMNSGHTSSTRHQQPAHHHHHRHPQHSLRKRHKNQRSHNSLLPGSEPTMKAPLSSVRNSTSMPPLSVATTTVNPLSCAVFPHAHNTLYKSKLIPPHADPIERLSAIVV